MRRGLFPVVLFGIAVNGFIGLSTPFERNRGICLSVLMNIENSLPSTFPASL